MSSSPTITASYSVAASSSESTIDPTSASAPLNFEAPINLSLETTTPPSDPSKPAAQFKKEQYLTALAAALSGLQDSINTGLTERLIQQGVLSETNTENDPSVNTKLRTKVPGQPNNSKKGQTKKQQQREQKQKEEEEEKNQTSLSGDNATTVESADTSTLRSLTPSSTITSTSMEVETSSTFEAVQDTEIQEKEEQYRPKGGIYGDDEDEDKQDKDEVDLVMEADPGEIDGACLELPKEEEQGAQQQQESQNKKRNELPADSADLAAAKKSRGSEDD
ncbi:hypothetical protein BGZ58_008015 [Dissophora ornata]|nr:hypothetical protein BGZ58_008015 [Dissophora ornata]